MAQSLIPFMRAWPAGDRHRPVFLWVHLDEPHAPYGGPDDKRRGFPVDPRLYGFVDPLRYESEAARRHREALYAEGVRSVDTALGALVAGAPQAELA